MNVRSRQLVRLLLLFVAIALPRSGVAQLNPTVKVLPRATTPVPPECTEGMVAQPAVRIPPDERDFVIRDAAKDMVPPPSATLRGELQKAFEAAQRNDRDAFRNSLGFAKKILANYPPGGERNAAENTIAVLDDIDELWEFLFTSSTGAFFDAGSDVYRTMSKYTGYEAFMRRQTIVDQNGVKFYPTHESRDFLLQETSAGYARLTGKRLPIAPAARRAVVPPSPPPPKTTQVVPPKPAPKPVHKEARATTPRTVRRTAHHKTTAFAPPSTTPAPPPRTVPATTTPPTTAELPPTTATSTTAPATTTETAATTAEPLTSTSTTMTAASTTTEAATEPVKPAETKKRNFLVPALLILVGIGVLVVLFRASS